MSEEQQKINVPLADPTTEAYEYAQDTLDQFLATADVNAAFGEAIEHEGKLIIPAAEVVAAMGFGYGGGSGRGQDEQEKSTGEGTGGGGGGGGKAFSRPVAVIIADQQGVQIKPVVDITKIYLAAFTALGFITAAWIKMGRGKV